jgi:hypothetical protein
VVRSARWPEMRRRPPGVVAGAGLPAGEPRPFARSFDETAGGFCSEATAEPTMTREIASAPLETAPALDRSPRRAPECWRPRPIVPIAPGKNGNIAGPADVRGWPYRVQRRKSPRVPWPVFSRGLGLNEFGHALSLSLALVDCGEKPSLRRGLKKSIADALARSAWTTHQSNYRS